jgi:hypothetical protein
MEPTTLMMACLFFGIPAGLAAYLGVARGRVHPRVGPIAGAILGTLVGVTVLMLGLGLASQGSIDSFIAVWPKLGPAFLQLATGSAFTAAIGTFAGGRVSERAASLGASLGAMLGAGIIGAHLLALAAQTRGTL